MDNLPNVSVIVPAYNSQRTIGKLIASLLDQAYPRQRFEIIVVDNNSTDATRDIVRCFPVKLLEQNSIQSSYAARNTGIENSSGEVLAFIDADCVASRQWLQEGVAKLFSENADLVGGKVEFLISAKKTISEMYDAITHFNMEWSIKKQGTTGSGNLFVRRGVFEKTGMFPQEARSGGDMRFTHKAVTGGCKLVYSPGAIVMHPARTFRELIEKSYRIGSGSVDVLMAKGLKRSRVLSTVLRDFLPPRPAYIRGLIEERGAPDMQARFHRIFVVSYLFRVVRGAGAGSNIWKLL